MRCPFCSEEILEGAAKCKDCGSDLVKQCPSCKETIHVQAQKCKHCGTDVSPKKALPFHPIPGATPTSGFIYFLLALAVAVLAVLLDPTGVMMILMVVGTSIWVAFDASKHKLGQYQSGLGGPAGACLGSLLLWIVAFPWYLAVRSGIRAGVRPAKT